MIVTTGPQRYDYPQTYPGKKKHMSGTYADLEVWQSAMDFAIEVYRNTASFPKNELWSDKPIKASCGIGTEQYCRRKGRRSDKELVQFLGQARGSLCEVETQIVLAQRLGYLNQGEAETTLHRAARLGQLLNGLIRAFRQSSIA